MTTRADTQVHIGLFEAELDEKDLGHPLVVVLARVHDPLLVTKRRESPDHPRGLHEVRPRAEHVGDRCLRGAPLTKVRDFRVPFALSFARAGPSPNSHTPWLYSQYIKFMFSLTVRDTCFILLW